MSRSFTDNINSFNLSNSFTFTAVDDEYQILAWLSPLEPRVRHQDIRTQRMDSIGDWLLETTEFRNWYNGSEKGESDHRALFGYGDPGAGKSYISSVVVDYLCDQAIERDMGVACFYYDFASREAQSPTNMLGSLLKQLLSSLEAIPAEIKRTFQRQKKVIGGRGLQLHDIVNMFPTISSLQRIFICVDALDECIPKHRIEVLDALSQILLRLPNTRMFMTGRSHIQRTIERGLGGRAICVPIKPVNNDIVTYLRMRLRKDTTPEVMDSGLEGDIMKGIPKEVSESFLLVSLKVDSILGETTIHQRRKRLHEIGDGLELADAYEETLQRIRTQEEKRVKLAITTLMWTCHSERPLLVDELCHALAVEIGSTHLNSDNVPAVETLLACCQGLVTVDKEALTVRLVHHTLREYLSTHRNLFPRAHSVMAETCLTYLNSDLAKAHPAKPQPRFSLMPFFKYCSRYWGTHAKRELSDRATSLAMELIDQYENHATANTLFKQLLSQHDSSEGNAPSLFSGLHCASFFGIVDIMAVLLRMNDYDVNCGDSAGITPLIWAVRGGQEEAVELLLGQEAIDPDKPDNNGITPLAQAAFNGRESVVKKLLGREDVSPDKSDNEGTTPLSLAAMEGCESVVKQLLDRHDVTPDKPENHGGTPLSFAAMGGHDSVVRLLFDREDVDPDKADNEGITPISHAAIGGHELVVKQLLSRGDVNPDKPDNNGITPLLRAAFNGSDSVVKQLLDRDEVNPNRPDNYGKTPLSLAAGKGHESVVRLLLDRGEVDPDQADNEGKTPLSLAAVFGHGSVVEQLLNREDVNPDRPDNNGITPLAQAAFNGRESVVKQLLGREDVNPDKPDKKGMTPLLLAAMEGHESVAKQLLDRYDVTPDKPDNHGGTPLSSAAMGGHDPVVRLLLDREDVDPDRADNEGTTPISHAAIGGHELVVKQLLNRGDVDPDKPDNNGITPLLRAVSSGHESVVERLLDSGEVNPDKPDNEGTTPLSLAAGKGHELVVKLLLSRGEVNPNRADNEGITPLSKAKLGGHEPIVNLLLGCGM